MAKNVLKRIIQGPSEDVTAPLGGSRAESVQRLQIGIAGIAGMILLVALADLIQDRALETEATSVPEAASTVAAKNTGGKQSDPLAEAGVVPDLPTEPAPTSPPGPERIGPQTQGGNAQ